MSSVASDAWLANLASTEFCQVFSVDVAIPQGFSCFRLVDGTGLYEHRNVRLLEQASVAYLLWWFYTECNEIGGRGETISIDTFRINSELVFVRTMPIKTTYADFASFAADLRMVCSVLPFLDGLNTMSDAELFDALLGAGNGNLASMELKWRIAVLENCSCHSNPTLGTMMTRLSESSMDNVTHVCFFRNDEKHIISTTLVRSFVVNGMTMCDVDYFHVMPVTKFAYILDHGSNSSFEEGVLRHMAKGTDFYITDIHDTLSPFETLHALCKCIAELFNPSLLSMGLEIWDTKANKTFYAAQNFGYAKLISRHGNAFVCNAIIGRADLEGRILASSPFDVLRRLYWRA